MKYSLILLATATLSFPAAAAALPAGSAPLAGHWPFDGDLADRSGNGQDAYAKAPVFTAGQTGQALRLNQNAVSIPDSPDLRLSPGFRLDCRVRFATLPEGNAWADVAMKGNYGQGEYVLRVNPAAEGHQFGFFVNTGTWEPRVQSVAPVRAGVWYQVAAGWDETGLWLTVDGETTRVVRTGLPVVTREPLTLGPFDGELDDLRIANPGASQAGVAFWPFDGNLRDVSGHGHDLTARNPTFSPVRGGAQALHAGPAALAVSNAPAFQLAPGFRLDCSVFFNEAPDGITPLVMKAGEYQLRVDPQAEGGHLSFFANLGGWEPRVRSECRVEPGSWYRVTAQWDGWNLILDVNGKWTKIPRAGTVNPGNSPLTIGPFNGLIDNLRLENPKLPVISLREFATENILLRAGRPERLTVEARNLGSPAAACEVALDLPPGVTCESPVTIALGALPSGARQILTWQVRADKAITAAATFRLTSNRLAPVLERRTLAFFPARDPDVSARAWDPPSSRPDVPAATHYVDSLHGSNTQAGTSPATAWQDFTPINGKTLGPGERLLIRRGSVINQELAVSAAGTAEAWAEIGVYGEGPRPVIRRNWHLDDRCMLVRNPDYLRIRSLVVCHAGKGLIVHYPSGGHRGLLIEDCIAHHIEGLYRPNSHGIPEWRDHTGATGDGLDISAGIGIVGAPVEDVLVRNCEMFQCSWGFFITGDGTVIDRVFCHDNHVRNTSPHPALVSTRRAYLQNCIFDASGWHAYAGTMGIMLVNPVGLIIRNCHFLNQPDSGSHDQGGIDFENSGDGCLIDHCTFRNNAGAAIEVLGLATPQTRHIEIADSRFFQNNVAHKLGPAEIYIWGQAPNPEVCCSTGIIRDNGYVLSPGVAFFTNEAPASTRWTLKGNTEHASAEALEQAMPHNNPPAVDAGPELWTDRPTALLAGSVVDDGKPASGGLKVAWELLEGPGGVTFRDPGTPATEAGFTLPGDYQLRLVADDGELWRSALTTVHVLPPGAAVARAWTFGKPLDKEGWSEAALGTRIMDWKDQPGPCVSYPVNEVAGGYYVVAVEDSAAAHLLSPDHLDVELAANRTVTLRFQNHTPATRMRIRFTTADAPVWDEGHGKTFAVTANDNGPRTYSVDMNGTPGWTGRLKQLRLDLADGTPLTGTCRIDYVWIGRSGT